MDMGFTFNKPKKFPVTISVQKVDGEYITISLDKINAIQKEKKHCTIILTDGNRIDTSDDFQFLVELCGYAKEAQSRGIN